ncbi:hypothetical protein L596_028811 [Steinernema carpocapsae]|nr:hypothetical protein L596_028811 [Steinernema carpocapsae]
MIVAKETKFVEEMSSLVSERDSEVEQLEKKCEEEFAKGKVTEASVLAVSKLNERIRELKKDYSFKIRNLAERQRNEYRDLIKYVYEMDRVPESVRAETPPASAIKKSMSFPSPHVSKPNLNGGVDEPFTIYIGAQLKSMHNARIMTIEKLSDCCLPNAPSGDREDNEEGDFLCESTRLQNAMSLYRRGVSAVVLLVKSDPMHHMKKRTDFARMCERSTELHFEGLEDQLKRISELIREGNKTRVIVDNSASSSSASLEPQKVFLKDGAESDFRVGDVYVTKHSNIASVNVVFHLVVDGSLESSDDISSRHPCINGIRNVIRLSAKYGVTNITFPLLLVETTNENMNGSWCMKRAELIFKCTKGFMMEVCATGSTSSTPGGASTTPAHYNMNFALPTQLPKNVYSQIVELFPTVFHLVPSVTG